MNGPQALIGASSARASTCAPWSRVRRRCTSSARWIGAQDGGVLALFEGVATARRRVRRIGGPAAVLLHLGPGLADGLANLHNAGGARSPVVAIVGAHATGHVRYDAPLQSDIEALGDRVGVGAHQRDHRDLAQDAMRAVAAARPGRSPPGLPADVSWSDGAALAAAPSPPSRLRATSQISAAAHVVSSGASRDAAARREGADRTRAAGGQPDRRRHRGQAARRDVPGADRARRRGAQRRPAGLPDRGGRDPAAGVRYLVLAGARSPVSFFAYPGQGGDLVPEAARSASWPAPTRTSRPRWTCWPARSRAGTEPILSERAPPPARRAGTADRDQPGQHGRRVAARARHRRRRGQHVGVGAAHGPGPRAAAQPADPHRRLDRAGPAGGDRRGDRGPGPPWCRWRRTGVRCTRSRRCGPRRASDSTSPRC